MTDATYALKVDLNRDFDFVDTDEELSARLLEAHWFNGFQGPFDAMCRDSFAEFLLHNYDGKYSPEKAGAISGLEKGKVVTLDVTSGVTERMFTGWVDRLIPLPDLFGAKTARLICDSWVSKAGRTKRWLVPIQQGVRVDEVVPTVIERSACYPPGIDSLAWLLGVSGMSELDSTTYLATSAVYLTAETSLITIGMIGSKWDDRTTVFNAVAEAVKREGVGRLFLGRDGKLVFWNREHQLTLTTVDQTFNDSHPVSGLRYDYSALSFNQVSVKFVNQRVGASPEVLAINSSEIDIAAVTEVIVTYPFSDPTSGARVRGQNVIAPVITTDFTARDAPDGGGSVVSSGITVTIRREGSGNAEISYLNTNAYPIYIQVNSQVRGTKVIDSGDGTVTALDGDSISSQGVLEYTFPNTVEDATYALTLAEYFLRLGQTPRGYVRSLWFEARADSTYMSDALSLGVGSLISISEGQTGVDEGLYFIISEEHWVTARPYRHKVEYKLEPASALSVWTLDSAGFSELDVSTVLSPW